MNLVLFLTFMVDLKMNCPDNETFELAVKLHNKLRYLTGGNEDDQDLVALLDCLIQDQRTILNSQTK